MTPEQTKAHWAIAGLPAMPEWILFCRTYGSTQTCMPELERWVLAVQKHYGPSTWGSFELGHGPGELTFVVDKFGDRYEWNLGESDA